MLQFFCMYKYNNAVCDEINMKKEGDVRDMFLEMKKASRFLAILLTIVMIFTCFCAPGIGSINAYADDSITTVPVTKVAIQGQLKVGETVTAVATGASDEQATNVTYEWQYENSYYDELEGDVVEYNPISGETTKTFTIPNSMKGKKICVIARGDSGSTATSEISSEIAADTSSDMETLEDILKDYQYGTLTPEFGLDNNIVTFLDKKIKEKYEGVNVTLKSSSMPETVATNGDITYFYKDIDAGGITTSNNYVQPQIVFTLSKGASSVELTKKANIYWDIDKLKADLIKYILSNITQEEIKGENLDLNNVKSNLTLSTEVNSKTYAKIHWNSNDSSVLEIKTEGDSWNPKYKGIVKPGAEDKNVTLTATVEYIFTNTDLQKTEISKLKKEFTVTVKANSTDVSQEMQNELNANYTIDKIKDSVSGAVIEPGNITGDIQFLSPSKTGIANSDLYRFTVTSSDPEVLKVNGYRGIIYRPLPGEADKNVKFTVTMAQKEGALSVSKDFFITVKPLVQKDIDNEIKLMEKAKASYFDGIKAENSSKENIVTNMHAFREAAFTADGETLEWVYNSTNDKKKGIEPVELPGYDSMGGASWRLFRSSRSDIIQDENLLVKKPKYNTKVTIDSMLSSIEYAKYAEKYKDNQDFKKLVNQPVSTVVTVPGTDGENPNAETKKVKVFASLYDGRNSIFPVPFGEIEVTAGLAKSYGYTNAHIEKHAAENEVTMFDTLVAMHAAAMGITSPKEENATKTIQGILSIGDSGFLGKIMNENAPFSLMKNGRMPNDGVYNEQYKAYNGYTVDNAVVDNSDVLNYFFFQNSAYGDYYSWFEKNGIEARELTVPKDEMVNLDLKGYMAMPYGCSKEEKIKEMITGLDGIQLAFCDNTGTLTNVEGAVTSNGKVSFTVDTKGEYIISAKGNEKTPLVAPYLKLTVSEGITEAEKQQLIAADKAALDFDDIKGLNENSQSVTENLKLIKIGNSGKTKITWTSNDASIIAPDGTVKRPLSEAGDKAVTVTATISYGSVTDTKVIELKVIKLPASDKVVDDIVAKLPVTITPKEWNDSALAKQDTNIIEIVRTLVKAENAAADVAAVCVPSEEQTQIAADGTITYGAKKVNNKKVTFKIQLGTVSKPYSPGVTVNKKAATKEDAFAAEWLTFDVFKGSNASENQVTSELSLPKEDTEDYYSELEWTSSDSQVVAIDSAATNGKFKAKVIRPALGQKNANVTLTAKIKPGSYWAYKEMAPAGPTPEPGYGTKTFKLIVPAVTEEEAGAAQILVDEAIKLFSLDNAIVRGSENKADLMNLTYSINNIPYNWEYVKNLKGFKQEYRAATVTWYSENPGIAKVDSGATVLRTASEQTGDIVLTISYNGKTATKRFATKIPAFNLADANAENALLKEIAEALTFDTIKKDNTDFYNVTSDMTVVEGAEKVNGIVTFGKKLYNKRGASISWASSKPSVINKSWKGLVVSRPLKDTQVTLTATLTDVMYPDCPGVQTVTKEIKVIVSGTGADKSVLNVYELMDNITAEYAAKDTKWWGGRSTGTFWNAIGMEAYKNYNTDTKNVISEDAKQAFVNKMIALAVEGDAKASVNANIQANAINGLSAMGYDASQLWTVNHSKFSAIEKLNTVNLEEAKTGWYSTIAPYVVNAFRQGNYNTKAQENAHIEYLKEQLTNASNWKYGVDTPAMIMQGLTPYYDRAEVKTVVDIAITKLSAKQGANGSFGNASADAMVIVSLAQLGINPVTDERFIKEGHTLLDGLLLYKTDDNKGFVYNKEYNEISTYQGLLGLIAAINVMDSAKPYNVYDFSKTAKVGAYANGTIAVEDEEPAEEPVDDKNITITFTLKADKGTWIPATTLTLKKDSKVYHAFVKALDDAGFTYVGAGNNYVSSITNKNGTTLEEFTNGRNSGWLYTVNGSAPTIGLKDYKLNDGDKLVWYYTNDWTKDPEAVKAAGGKSAIAEFVEKEKATGKTEVQATTDKDGKASAEVKTKDINDAIEAVVKASEKSGATAKKEVKIVVKADDKAKEVETKLPKDSMVELNKKVDVVTVQTPLADISFDKQNLELMSKNINGDVKLSVRKVDIAKEGNISEESKCNIKEKVGDRPILDFNLTVGDKKISNFADNVQVSIPYSASQNENVNGIVVYYINDKGNLETVKDCQYDSKTKTLTFSTNHFSNYAVGYKNISFDDISKHWAKDQIVYLAARDVVKGVNNTGFAPNDKVTRAEFVQILANLSGADLSKYGDSKFKDVKKDVWFANSAAWAAELGLVTGNSNNDGTVSFNPNESITRQDMAVILSRYMSKIERKKLREVNKEVKFADKNQIGGYAESAVAELQKAGVINGKTTDSFAPKENATRAECSKMISVLMQNYL